MIFAIYYVAALALVAAELRGVLRVRALPTPARVPGWAWVALLVATYAVQIALSAARAKSGPGPLPVVTWNEGSTEFVIAMLACGAVQSYALIALYRSKAPLPALAVGAALMLAGSVVAPVLLNQDMYAYAGDAILGRQAYAPPSSPFDGEFSAINGWWGTPMPPSTYGPLWLALAHTITAPFGTLLTKMLALRALGAAALAATFILLRAMRTPSRILMLVALNPALYLQFVLDAHNDLVPCAIVLGAALVARARPALAGALVAAAALAKLPFALAGLPVLARIETRAQRIAAVVFAIVAAAAVSWIAGREPYLHALTQHAEGSKLFNAVHVAAAVAAIGILAIALFGGARRLRSAVWLIPSIGAYTTPWYALWSLPYAIGARRVATYGLALFPFVSVLVEPSLARGWTILALVPLSVVLSLSPPARNRTGHGVRSGAP